VGLEILAGFELQRNNAHADQIAAMNAFEALRDGRLDTEQPRTLGGPVAGRAGAVFFAGDHDQRHPFFFVLHRGIVDRHLLFIGQMHRHAAFGSRRQKILQPDVSESSAHHNFVVPTARAVLIEVFRENIIVNEITRCRAVFLDGSGRRNMVRGDRVAD
jgi:hypothetical protein